MNVIWSPRAKITYFRILEYLAENWTGKEVESFHHRTETVIKLIQQNPNIYPYSRKEDVHKCVLVKQVSLFYRIRNDQIELLVFWDNRQSPEKLFAS